MLFILVLMLCGCKLSYESMVDELNSNFTPPVKEPSITDPNYDYSRMINRDFYIVSEGSVLFLIGPQGAREYKWEINGVEVSKDKDLFFNCEEGGMNQNTEYTLRLEITLPGSGEAKFSDKAKIIYIGS